MTAPFPYRAIAVVPARGGSKTVPRKNIRVIAGKPMIAYTLEAARACALISQVLVSTEDDEIAAVARQWGGDVPFRRPAELAGDDVTDLPVITHALRWLASAGEPPPDIVVHLRPTAPLRRTEHIEQGLRLLVESGADSARSVTRAGQHPFKMWVLDGGWLAPFIRSGGPGPEPYNMPRQKLPPAYIQNGSVDVAWTRTILELGSMTGRRIAGFEMDELDSINVDSALDLGMAEWLLSRRFERVVRSEAR